jgi:hypothetical protein
MEFIPPTVTAFLFQIPIFLVWIVTLILALVFWQKHPKISALVVIVVLGFLTLNLIDTPLNLWLPLYLREQGLGVQQISIIYLARTVVTNLLTAVLWILLTVAVFGWRKKEQQA